VTIYALFRAINLENIQNLTPKSFLKIHKLFFFSANIVPKVLKFGHSVSIGIIKLLYWRIFEILFFWKFMMTRKGQNRRKIAEKGKKRSKNQNLKKSPIQKFYYANTHAVSKFHHYRCNIG